MLQRINRYTICMITNNKVGEFIRAIWEAGQTVDNALLDKALRDDEFFFAMQKIPSKLHIRNKNGTCRISLNLFLFSFLLRSRSHLKIPSLLQLY
jgi:hypothetical protein